jgi:phage terminase small subunit
MKTKESELNNAELLGKQLTEKQQKFCEYGVFLTGLDWVKAADLAGYSVGTEEQYAKYENQGLADYYRNMQWLRIARENLKLPHVLRFIKALREEMDNQLIVDKLWVINKLKKMADEGSERTQLEATKLLGQTMNMFQAETQVVVADDPSAIVQKAFAERMKKEKEQNKNIVPFNKEGSNE